MVDYTALTGSLDLFVLMTSYVAGGILLSLILWAFILLITGIMGRLSMNTILIVIITYFVAVGVGYTGALFAVPLLLWALWYAISGIINYINMMR